MMWETWVSFSLELHSAAKLQQTDCTMTDLNILLHLECSYSEHRWFELCCNNLALKTQVILYYKCYCGCQLNSLPRLSVSTEHLEHMQVLPLARKHCSEEEQRDLLYQSLRVMPLKLLERVLPWLVGVLNEDEAKDMLHNMRLAGINI